MIPGIVAQATPGFPAPIGDGTVELLLGFNGTDGATIFREEGQRNVPVSVVGNTHISNVQAKFGSTSARFDGGDDGLIFPHHEGFDFGSGKFTVEGWFYPTSNATQMLVCSRIGDAAALVSWSVAMVNGSSRNLEFIWSDGTTATNLTGTGTAALNGWNHFALCRGTDGVVRLFLNGVLQVSLDNATAGAMWNPKRFPLALGIIPTILTADFNGFMDEVRVIKGEAVYDGSATFTPPVAPFSRPVRDSLVPSLDPDFDDVLLLLGYDSTDIYDMRDDSSYHRSATRLNVGSFINPNQPGIGYRSSQRIESSSFIIYDDSNDWFFGTDPFTVECWVRPNGSSGFQHIIGQRNGGSSPTSWVLTLLASTAELEYIASSGGTTAQQTSGANTVHSRSWNHIALARDATGVFRLFVNGVMRAKDASKTAMSIQNIAYPMTIGARAGGGNFYTGDIDEVRVTRGTCRYSTDASFYPSFKPFSRGEIGPPAVSEQPEIISRSGFFAPGDVLDLDLGVADGYEPVVQWRRGGVNVGGATGTIYTLTESDVGEVIDARVTWWNYSGTTTATAAGVGPVAAEPLFDTGGLAPAGDMQSGTDRLIPVGDMQDGTDVLLWKERTQ